METRKLGSLDVTVVGLGCNNFGRRLDAARTKAVVDACLEHGITFFDTADVYGGDGRSEEYLGRALGPRRDEALIATKFGSPMNDDPDHQGGSARWVRQAAEDSLRRLGTDRIDLYQMHRPDPETPIEETLAALDGLVRAGKVVEIGCSNFSVEQIEEAHRVAEEHGYARFVSVQNEYSLFQREPEEGVLEACERLGLGFLPYFPLASGLLTGKYRLGEPHPDGTRIAADSDAVSEEKLVRVERLISLAEEHGHTLLELAFGWLLSTAVVASVIAGATSPEQVAANAAAAGWRPTADELDEIEAVVA
jgi:aryl-alcohol dehydrogenase-like predicted oxidoreductase